MLCILLVLCPALRGGSAFGHSSNQATDDDALRHLAFRRALPARREPRHRQQRSPAPPGVRQPRKIYDLLVRAQAIAKANGRDVMQALDVPVTKGLQERLHEFRELNEEVELQPILESTPAFPPLDLDYSDELSAMLPELAGALTVALARSFRFIDPTLKNPQTPHWERALGIFDLLSERRHARTPDGRGLSDTWARSAR